MNEKRRNLAVGATVLVALVLLGAMILLFAGMPEIFERGYDVRIRTDNTHDVHVGDQVHLVGVPIGRVTAMEFTNPRQPEQGVTFTVRIKRNVDLPGNVDCFMYGGGIGRGTWVEFGTVARFVTDPRTGKPLPYIPKDYVITLEGVYKGSSIIPQEVTDALKSFGDLSKSIQAMIGPLAATGEAGTQVASTTTSAPAAAGLQDTLAKLNRTLDGLSAIVSDQQNQANFKTTLANLTKATSAGIEAMAAIKAFASSALGSTAKASDDIHALSLKLVEDAEKISQLMMTLNKAAMKIEAGDGTAGKLLNDPALYNSLVEMSKGLNTLVNDFDALVKHWKEQGVNIKVK